MHGNALWTTNDPDNDYPKDRDILQLSVSSAHPQIPVVQGSSAGGS